jgi:hypothetical protein
MRGSQSVWLTGRSTWLTRVVRRPSVIFRAPAAVNYHKPARAWWCSRLRSPSFSDHRAQCAMRDNRACRTSVAGHGLRTGQVCRKAVVAAARMAAVLHPVAAAVGTGQQPGLRPGSHGDFWAVQRAMCFTGAATTAQAGTVQAAELLANNGCPCPQTCLSFRRHQTNEAEPMNHAIFTCPLSDRWCAY